MAESRISRPKSHEALRRAKRVMPGGVNSPVRSLSQVGGEPPFLARGQGPFVYDIDGLEYVDCVGGRGSMILGHQHPRVMAAIESELKSSSAFAAPTERETELAELIVEAVPSIEMVRLVDSTTEAVAGAIRLARGYTGRDMIVRFAGSYHGDVDSLMVASGSSTILAGMPAGPGISFGATNGTLVVHYNDVAAVHEAFSQHGDLIAGVIVEPVATNMGLVPATNELLQTVRDQCDQHESLLIFDEVTTGFRVSAGGAQLTYGIDPDITVLGKVMGGGWPIGAIGGKRNIMHRLMPTGPVMLGSNAAGHMLITSAGIATLRELRDHPPYQRLETLGLRLEDGLRDQLTSAEIPHWVSRVGSMWTVYFADWPVGNLEAAKHCDTGRYCRFFWAMMDRNIYWPTSQLETGFLSSAHDESVVDRILNSTQDTIKFMAGFVN